MAEAAREVDKEDLLRFGGELSSLGRSVGRSLSKRLVGEQGGERDAGEAASDVPKELSAGGEPVCSFTLITAHLRIPGPMQEAEPFNLNRRSRPNGAIPS